MMSISRKPTVLIVLDGWGYREERDHNAIAQANTPIWDKLWSSSPHTLISGSGLDVGLPEGQMGNSEVGHTHLGAGRTVYQDLTRISKAIEQGEFQQNTAFSDLIDQLKNNQKSLHIFGLLSPGGIHSHQSHIHTLCELAASRGLTRVFVHAILDGRDMPPRSAGDAITTMENKLSQLKLPPIVSIIGRYYAMDRDQRWERIKPAYELYTQGNAEFTANNATEGLIQAYERDESDEFVQATVIQTNDQAPITINDGDGIIFMNFRADRARQLTRAFLDPKFSDFHRKVAPKLSGFVSLTEYASDLPTIVAYPPEKLENDLGDYLAKLGKTQLRMAETEKYAHVTFFFNGGREAPYNGEDRKLIPSPKVATYDLQPEMSAFELTDALVQAITGGQYDFILCNYANPDMVGHTGKFDAAIKAVETIDQCLGKIQQALESVDGQALITADHGNVECMYNIETQQSHTAHTTELVPLVYMGKQKVKFTPIQGNLSDVAPTLLQLMMLDQPTEMTGQSLLISEDS